jgi:SAM-dependent methyltransferase
MNLVHRWLCSSSLWRKQVRDSVLPWTLQDLELGPKVLEIGPGPGITTDSLANRFDNLTCMEIDRGYAAALSRRMTDKNVNVICGDGTAAPLPDAAFDSVLCFTMLHHVPSSALQDSLFAEAARVLRPGGVFAGYDSLSSLPFRLFHAFDTAITVDPDRLPSRLKTAGFDEIQVDANAHGFRFRAWKSR